MKILFPAVLVLFGATVLACFLWMRGSSRRNHPADKSPLSEPNGSQRQARISYEESCRALQRLGYIGDGALPPLPDHRPRHDDDEPLGVEFFRTAVSEGNLANLTLPRTFFGRSEIGPVTFRNSDLSESNLCWNDFLETDFTDCDLIGSDLRASSFKKVRFVNANLRDTDLRRSSFEACDFTGACMHGAKLSTLQGNGLHLSDQQRKEIEWQSSDGDEPDGG